MLRPVVTALLLVSALAAGASDQSRFLDGAWVFDNAPPYPATQIGFAPADAGMESLTAVRDLWKGADRKASETTFNVPAHGTVMLRVRGR